MQRPQRPYENSNQDADATRAAEAAHKGTAPAEMANEDAERAEAAVTAETHTKTTDLEEVLQKLECEL